MGVDWGSDVRFVRRLGRGFGGFARIGVFGCTRGPPRRRGTGTFSRWPFSVGGWVAGLDADLMGRENEPVPGDHRGWASIGSRMFALCVPRVAVMAGLRGLGFRMCAWSAPAEGDRHIFPLGFFGWGLVGWVGYWFDGGGKMSQSPG